jgi:CheY-like chemotaxis protein
MADAQSQRAVVLIVEDEHLIRMDTAAVFESAGFKVYEADNAAAAIRWLELHDEIRLVFTDVNMPGWMNGLALAHYIHGRWPPVKIMVTSGYVNAQHSGLPEEALFVEKPYYSEDVVQKINELMAA